MSPAGVGQGLRNVFSAREFVWWYNGHPDYRDLPVDLSKVGRHLSLRVPRHLPLAAAQSSLTSWWCWMPPSCSHPGGAGCPPQPRPGALGVRQVACGIPQQPPGLWLFTAARSAGGAPRPPARFPSAPAVPPAGAARGRAGHGQRRGGLRAHAAAAARPPGGHRRGAPRARAAGRERGAQRRPRRPARARAGARRAAQLANPRSLLGAAGAHLGG